MSSKSLLNKEFMILALEEATLAMSEGEIPVGAVIVKDGQVIARAHNEREKGKNPLYHIRCKNIKNQDKMQNIRCFFAMNTTRSLLPLNI